MSTRIFLAGASGAVGRVLARLLLGNGWNLFGSTRTLDKAAQRKKAGVEPTVVDVFDAEALRHRLYQIGDPPAHRFPFCAGSW